jgi:hypothetical protein
MGSFPMVPRCGILIFRRCLISEKKRLLGCAHRYRPTYPDFLHGAPPTSACAAFIKESRMEFAGAGKLDRKSGVRFGERGAPVQFLSLLLGPDELAG